MGKIPPQARDLEKAVLGAIMLEKGAFDIANGIIKTECFYVDAHQHVYDACKNLALNYSAIDLLTVVEALKAMGKLEEVGGAYYISSLTNSVASSAHLDMHCRIISQKFIQRKMIELGNRLVLDGFDDTTDPFDLFDTAEKEMFRISNSFFQSNYQNAKQLAAANYKQISALQNKEIDLTGVPTGFKCVDNLTCGWQPTDLIILAARPSVGKTALALNLAINAASSPIKKVGVGIFSLEMSSGQLTNRIAAYISQVGLNKISRGRMDNIEMEQYSQSLDIFSNLNIQIDDSASLNIHQIRSKARQMVNKEKVGMIIIDYLQLMSGDKERNGNREQEISTISRSLKALAKELQVPVIALSQMSRAVEGRKGQEPMLSDLRESGAIEQDADVVIFTMRDDYGMKQEDADPTLANKAWLKFAKHRNGSLEKLAFETDLSTQTWKESISNSWRPISSKERDDVPAYIIPSSPTTSVDNFNTDNSDDDMPF